MYNRATSAKKATKKAPSKKVAKKAPAKKVSKKAAAKKAPAKKAAKKAPAKKAAKRAPAKKAAKKAPAKKAAKRAPAKKAAKKAPAKKETKKVAPRKAVYRKNPKMAPAKCYFTTACVEYFGLPDNCIQLNTLRHYRDTILINYPDGINLINTYYKVAPKIIKMIENSIYRDIEYNNILNHINKSCNLINNGLFVEAKKEYTIMVNYLINKYLK